MDRKGLFYNTYNIFTRNKHPLSVVSVLFLYLKDLNCTKIGDSNRKKRLNHLFSFETPMSLERIDRFMNNLTISKH